MKYRFDAELWLYDGDNPWVFVTLPREESDQIADSVEWRPGFGSVKVAVKLGSSSWATSLFPSRELKAYVLPVKKSIRLAEGLDVGDVGSFEIEVVLAESLENGA